MRPLWLVLVGAWVGCSNDGASVNPQAGTTACITGAACGIITGGVSACTAGVAGVNIDFIANLARFTAAEVNCIAAAGADCNAARKCLNGGTTPAPCTGTSSSCMGNNLVTCTEKTGTNGTKATRSFDCSAVGLMCVAAGATIDCAAGTCAGLAASCSGTQLQYCDGTGILRTFDCADFGGSCVTTGVAHCRGTGPTCSQTGNPLDPPPIRCDGTTLVRCADGQEARFDCARMGLGCFANAGGKPFGCARGIECQSNAFSATCASNRLSYCDNGVLATYNCITSGFSTCDPSDGGRCKL